MRPKSSANIHRPSEPRRPPGQAYLETAAGKLLIYAGVAGAEALLHVVHLMGAPVLAQYVDAHLHETQRQSLWHDAALEWLPTSLALASLFVLYRHLRAHTAWFYVRPQC